MEAIFSKGILGMRALHKLYRCVARFPNISSEDQVKKVVLIAVVENKEDDRKVDSPAPYETYTSSYAFDKHFHNWSTYCDVIRAGEDAYNRLFEDIPPQDDRRTDEQKKKDQDQRTVLLNAAQEICGCHFAQDSRGIAWKPGSTEEDQRLAAMVPYIL